MAAQGRAQVIVNRRSSRGDASLEAALRRLEKAGLEVRLQRARRPAAIPELVRAGARDAARVVVGGGDGTLHAALPALLETGAALGVLPLGTANDLARTLGIPSDPEAAAAVVAEGLTRRVDVAWADATPFLNAASAGLSTQVARRLDRGFKQRFGALAYPLAALRVVPRRRVFHARLRTPDGERSVRAIQLVVANGRYQGGGHAVSDAARIDDGLLDVLALEPGPAWRLALCAAAFRLGRHRGLDGVHLLRTPALDLETDRPLGVDLDGELDGRTPLRFRVDAGRLPVYVPSEPGPGESGAPAQGERPGETP